MEWRPFRARGQWSRGKDAKRPAWPEPWSGERKGSSVRSDPVGL